MESESLGSRGWLERFPSYVNSTLMKDLGYKGGERKKAIERLSKVAEEASHSLWKASHYKKWGGHS